MQGNYNCCIVKLSTNTQNQHRCPVWKILKYMHTHNSLPFFSEIGFEKEKTVFNQLDLYNQDQYMVFNIYIPEN